ncbi:MAG: class IV adenylate cyclase [Candidatus Eisenbacteria bacterium]
MQNLEVKARLRDLAAARSTAQALGAEHRGELRQTDTYFHVPSGRLKLREIEGAPAELIIYHRPSLADTRSSDYDLTVVEDPRGLARILTRALGQRVVVRKVRELWWVDRTRLHLDRVEGLGDFFEFEVEVLSEEDPAPRHALAARLRQAFDLTDDRLIAGSYADLLDPR